MHQMEGVTGLGIITPMRSEMGPNAISTAPISATAGLFPPGSQVANAAYGSLDQIIKTINTTHPYGHGASPMMIHSINTNSNSTIDTSQAQASLQSNPDQAITQLATDHSPVQRTSSDTLRQSGGASVGTWSEISLTLLKHKLWWKLLSTDERAIFYPIIMYLPDQFDSLGRFQTLLFDENIVSRQDGLRQGKFRRKDGTFEDCLEPIPPKMYFRKFIHIQDITLEHPDNSQIKNEEDKDHIKDVRLSFQMTTRKCPLGWDHEKEKHALYDFDPTKKPTLWEYTICIETKLGCHSHILSRIVQIDQYIGHPPPTWQDILKIWNRTAADSLKLLKAELRHWMNCLVQQHNQGLSPQTLGTGAQHRNQNEISNMRMQSPAPWSSETLNRLSSGLGEISSTSATKPGSTFHDSKWSTDPQMTPATTHQGISINSDKKNHNSYPGPQIPPLGSTAAQYSPSQEERQISAKQIGKVLTGISGRGSKASSPESDSTMNPSLQQSKKRRLDQTQGMATSAQAAKRSAVSNQASPARRTSDQQAPTLPRAQHFTGQPPQGGSSSDQTSRSGKLRSTQKMLSGETMQDLQRRNKAIDKRLAEIARELVYLKLPSIEQTRANAERQRTLETEGYYLQQDQKMIYRTIGNLVQGTKLLTEATKSPKSRQKITPQPEDQHPQASASSVGTTHSRLQILTNNKRLSSGNQPVQMLSSQPHLAQQVNQTNGPTDMHLLKDRQQGQHTANKHHLVSLTPQSEGTDQFSHSQQRSGPVHPNPQAVPFATFQNPLQHSKWQNLHSLQVNSDYQSHKIAQHYHSQKEVNLKTQQLKQQMTGQADHQEHCTPPQIGSDQYQKQNKDLQYGDGQNHQLQHKHSATSSNRGTIDGGRKVSKIQVFGRPVNQVPISSSRSSHQNQILSSRQELSYGSLLEQNSSISHAHGLSRHLVDEGRATKEIASNGQQNKNNTGFPDAIYQRAHNEVMHQIGDRTFSHTRRKLAGDTGSLESERMNAFDLSEDAENRSSV